MCLRRASWSCDLLDELFIKINNRMTVFVSGGAKKVKKEEVTPAEDGADSRPQPEREQTVQVKKEEISSSRDNAYDEDVHVSEPRDGTDSTPPSDATFDGTSTVKECRIIDTK